MLCVICLRSWIQMGRIILYWTKIMNRRIVVWINNLVVITVTFWGVNVYLCSSLVFCIPLHFIRDIFGNVVIAKASWWGVAVIVVYSILIELFINFFIISVVFSNWGIRLVGIWRVSWLSNYLLFILVLRIHFHSSNHFFALYLLGT